MVSRPGKSNSQIVIITLMPSNLFHVYCNKIKKNLRIIYYIIVTVQFILGQRQKRKLIYKSNKFDKYVQNNG